MLAIRNLKRVTEHGWFGGVCSGLAYWTRTPTWLWRLGSAVLFLCAGVGLVPYILLWIFMPKCEQTPVDYNEATGG